MIIPGTVIKGRYAVERFLAKGGGGFVYEAHDLINKRRVALKQLIHAEEFLRKAFIREAKRLAALHHPAFPEVYEWFESKGHSFLVMEYIPGDDLRQALRNRRAPFPVEQVLEWAFILLDALDYLHNFDPIAPIIHRDIKPENLKLNETNRIRRNAIIIIDFGLSKGAGRGISQNSAGESIVGGTRYYAPPEQEFKFHPLACHLSSSSGSTGQTNFLTQPTDARSDIYSLAATLYTLLTDATPSDAVERVCRIREGDGDSLTPIRDINGQVPHVIASIIERAMSVEPSRRFASAAEMDTALRAASQAAARTADASEARHDMAATETSNVSLSGSTVKLVMDDTASSLEPSEYPPTLPARVREVRYGILGRCDAAVRSVSFSPHGTRLASGGNDGTLRLWNTSTGEVTVLGQCLPGQTGLAYISSVSFAPDGGTVASASNDGAIRLWRTAGVVRGEARVLAVCRNPPRSVAFSPSGKHIISGGSDGVVQLWDVESGDGVTLGLCEGVVWSVAVSPDGDFAAAESDDGTVRIWQLGEGRAARTLQASDTDIRSVAISPDGKLVAAAGRDGHIRVADPGAGHMRDLATCDDGIRSIAFSPDGATLAVGGEDKFLRVCDVRTGALRTLGRCDDFISSVSFCSDNRTIASGAWDKTVRLWDVTG
jgi:WD40 repeat protein/tRNA A-37 threonylcarbamoyl transferase component Bud32